MQRSKPYKKKLWGDDRGLTLIEAMIGILVFSVGVMGVCSMIFKSHESYFEARQSTREVNATALSLEPLKHAGYGNDNVMQDDSLTPGPDPFQAPGYHNYIQYRVWDNALVSGTKLIAMQNGQVSKKAGVPAFAVFMTKPEIR